MNKTGIGRPPNSPLVWPAKLIEAVPFYTKNCPEWFYGFGGAAICIYRWVGYWPQADSDVPAWMPEYSEAFPGDLLVPTGRWTPEQPWFNEYQDKRITGGWALNTAEYQYLGSVQRSRGSCVTCDGGLLGGPTQVTMFWGLFRDFNRCDLEPRTPYLVPMFHFHMTIPAYNECG